MTYKLDSKKEKRKKLGGSLLALHPGGLLILDSSVRR
jgi:hypothetical protein